VGQGGFGTVFKARDPELDRTVAIKVPRAGNLTDPQELDRFLREARSVAQLRHPSIVSVHEVGQTDGVPYIVSDFVRGVTLADLLSARRPGFREAAELVADIADALQYAHERGVVHRDVKPSNIMIGEDGRPCVMDFGLAKREAGEITMTIEGQVLGTPAYMSPEQARGEGHDVDGRGDVYSLGVVLYQLLTGELPFRGTQRMLLHQVLHDEPRSPRSLNEHIPRDLETIALTAMAKEPGRRYATAQAMADDLRRWLKGEPIQARPVGRIERVARWARRRPAVAALLMMSGVTALALVGLGVGLYFNTKLDEAFQGEAAAHTKAEEARKAADAARIQAEEAKKNEEVQRHIAEDAKAQADQTSYFHSIFLADLALKENNLLLAQQRLKECREDLRNWEWRYLEAKFHSELFSVPGYGASFSPDGSRIAVSGSDGVVRLYDACTGQETLILKTRKGLVAPVFSPDGARIAVAPAARLPGAPPATRVDAMVGLYDARSGEELVVLEAPVPLGQPVFSPDGARIAVAPGFPGPSSDGVVRVYDARTGRRIFAFKGEPFPLPVFSPDGARIAVGTWSARDMGIRLFDARTGQEQEKFSPKGPATRGNPVFSPDSSRIAVGGMDGMVRVYDARTGQETLALKGPAQLLQPVFSPDGTRIAVAPGFPGPGSDGVVRVYDARKGQEILALKGPAPFSNPVFSPDGARIAVTPPLWGGDGVVRIYEVTTGQEALVLKAPKELLSAQFSPDGSRILARGEDAVWLYDVRTNPENLTLKEPDQSISSEFSPDGVRIALHVRALRSDGVVRLYDTRTGQEVLAISASAKLASPVFSPDGSRLAVLGDDRVLRIYDARTGEEIQALRGQAGLGHPKFSPDGAHIAVAPSPVRGDGVVRVYDARTGQENLVLKGLAPLGLPLFSPDGAHIAATPAETMSPEIAAATGAVSGDGMVRVYDARTGQAVSVLKGPAPMWSILFSPDGGCIAAAGGDGVVRLYNVRTGRQALVLQAPDRLSAPKFSPDGLQVAVRDNESVRLFDARTGQPTAALKGPTGLSTFTFSPDGSRIVTRGSDGVVRLYDTRTTQEALAFKASVSITGHPEFSADGARIATGCTKEGVVKVWTAPQDTAVWQAERRAAFRASVPAWHRARADVSERASDWFAAVFHLQRLCDIASAEPRHFFRHAIALIRLGKVDESRASLDKAVQVAEKNPPADKTRQLQLQDLRRQAEALLKEPPPDPKK
jgi:WD40 repeat protein